MSFTAANTTVKVSVSVRFPSSLTLTVISACPDISASGITVIVLVAPVVLMFTLFISVSLSHVALTTRLSSEVSTSPILQLVTIFVSSEPSSSSAMSLIVGASFTGLLL